MAQYTSIQLQKKWHKLMFQKTLLKNIYFQESNDTFSRKFLSKNKSCSSTTKTIYNSEQNFNIIPIHTTLQPSFPH